MKDNDWFLKLIREMIKDHSTLVNLGKMKIMREKDTLTGFHFDITTNKSVFEDLLSEEEKAMLWLEDSTER